MSDQVLFIGFCGVFWLSSYCKGSSCSHVSVSLDKSLNSKLLPVGQDSSLHGRSTNLNVCGSVCVNERQLLKCFVWQKTSILMQFIYYL